MCLICTYKIDINMKKFNYFAVVMALMMTVTAFGQNTKDKWLLGVGMHAVDYTSVRGAFDGYFDYDDYSIVPPLSKLTVSRSLSKWFAVDLEASIGEVDNDRINIQDEFYILAGLGLRLKLANDKILPESSWFDPYVRVGANYHKYDYSSFTPGTVAGDGSGGTTPTLDQNVVGSEDNFAVNGGIGLNFWIAKNFGVNVESQYVWVPDTQTDYFDHFQHSASLIFRFGAPKGPCDDLGGDTDGDGICDEEDDCVDVIGVASSMEGCNGCPDADSDGICDAKDDCVNEAGTEEFNGCPPPACHGKGGDSDGDGLCDTEDPCPNSTNNGDSDGDGILDCNDKCPNEAGPASREGCPKSDIEIIAGCDDLKDLLFKLNSAKVQASEEVKLDSAAKCLRKVKNRDLIIVLEGHTDVRGSAAYNKKLSQKRATEVANQLKAKGVQNPIEAIGYGEERPTCTDNTDACHQANRRVVVKAKK